MSNFVETDHPRTTTGRFATKSNSAPGAELTAPEGAAEHDYWESTAAELGLSDRERELLYAHVTAKNEAGEESYLTLMPGSTVAADALIPEVTARWDRFREAETNIEEKLTREAFVAFDELDGRPALTATYEDVDDNELVCFSDGEQLAYVLNGNRYAEPGAMPSAHAEAREQADRFSAHASLYPEAIRLRGEYDEVEQRAMRLRLRA